jgi:hypothetical protein
MTYRIAADGHVRDAESNSALFLPANSVIPNESIARYSESELNAHVRSGLFLFDDSNKKMPTESKKKGAKSDE